jgi:hypothetical protein
MFNSVVIKYVVLGHAELVPNQDLKWQACRSMPIHVVYKKARTIIKRKMPSNLLLLLAADRVENIRALNLRIQFVAGISVLQQVKTLEC